MPSVAIIVLNFNGETCLPTCLRSLGKLHYSEKQIIVVDNGSTDSSFIEAQKEFPEYTYISKSENTGFSGGMNTGIEYALAEGHDFVWLMNYDAEVLPDTLDVLIGAHLNDPRIEVASPRILDRNHQDWFCGGEINYLKMQTIHLRQCPKAKDPFPTGFLTGCALFVKSSLFREVGLLDERFFLYYEDADFSERVKATGRTLWVVPQAKVFHEEKSQENPKKLYYLVLYGMLFFALHTPFYWRVYLVLYVTIRRAVNQVKLILRAPRASIVHQGYADYFEKFQPNNKLYIRKLS